jgi:hypothetical protein
MTNTRFLRWTGLALACGGALTFLLNASLTPLLPRGGSFVETARSSVFLWRQSAAALAVALLLFGSVGLYLRQAERAGRFGAIAFAAAFLGSALVLATEWTQIFDVRDLAFRAPDTLRALEAGRGPHLSDIGALIALGIFTLGWIALAVSTLRAGLLSRRAATLVIVGFFAIPLLGAAGLWGAVAGNAILGSGWCWLGWEVFATSDH